MRKDSKNNAKPKLSTILRLLQLIYDLGIRLYGLALSIASLFHPKAKKWIAGRKNWQKKLEEQLQKAGEGKCIWFHCASLGEFEQGRNLIEEIKSRNPDIHILLSFFSPSGFEIRKDYTLADYVCYLPLDTPSNARIFLEAIHPALAFFVKYELWLNMLSELEKRSIPTILISARLDKKSPFLTSIFAPLYRKVFRSFRHIFTQDEQTQQLLLPFCMPEQLSLSADTRFDRVLANRKGFSAIPEIADFKGDDICLIAGSTWPQGENLLFEAFRHFAEQFPIKLILAPHEIKSDRITAWEEKFPNISLRFSQIDQLNPLHRILWIDNIGMLSRLYHYADIAYVGGAFGSGLHNILEAATFGCPLIIGPNHHKFPEAAELIQYGGCRSVSNVQECIAVLENLLKSPQHRAEIRRINTAYIDQRAGATQQIYDWCTKAGLL